MNQFSFRSVATAALACGLCLLGQQASADPQAPGDAAPATPPAETAQAEPAAGGVAIEFTKGAGTGVGASKDAEGQAMEFLRERGWSLGTNHDAKYGDLKVYLGKASLPCGADDQAFDQCRRQAFTNAMTNAKKELALYLAAQITTNMTQSYSEGNAIKTVREAKKAADEAAVRQKPTAIDKLEALLMHELDAVLKSRGIDPALDTAENEKKVSSVAKEIHSSETFKRAVEVAAEHELFGLQAFRCFEDIRPGSNGAIAVVAIYSEKTAKLHAALLGGAEVPKQVPKESIARWAEGLGDKVLLYTHGCHARVDDTGELVLVAFGQSTPIGKAERQLDAAQKKAVIQALGAARQFMGEYFSCQDSDSEASTLAIYADASQEFQPGSGYSEVVNARAEKLTMPGGSPAYKWKLQHPLSDRVTCGCVMTFSVSSALAANKLSDSMKAAGGAAGGKGISAKRAVEPTTTQPVPSKKSGQGSSGAGAAGDEP